VTFVLLLRGNSRKTKDGGRFFDVTFESGPGKTTVGKAWYKKGKKGDSERTSLDNRKFLPAESLKSDLRRESPRPKGLRRSGGEMRKNVNEEIKNKRG